MIRMYVRHSVENYDAWRKAYDAFDAERQTMGVVAAGIYQALDNPNDITGYHDFATAEQAEGFAGSAQVRDAMQRAGVIGKPDIWFVKEAG